MPQKQRSRASNRPLDLASGDKRSAAARRFRDLCSDLVSDQGGIAQIGTVRQQLVRRFAAASVLLEQLDARIASGVAIDVSEYAVLVGVVNRLSQRLGMNRRAKRVATLEEYLSGEATAEELPDE